MKKEGVKAQASVITIVLIILVSLVAVIIVWNVVNVTIKNSSDQVGVGQFALKGDIKYYLVPGGDSINVSVYRGAGSGNITGIKLIFEFTDGTSKVYENRTVYPNELETKVYQILNTRLGVLDFLNVKEISVVGHY